MSNLQVLARRCPVMGKALTVQSARTGNSALAGAFGGARAYHTRVNRAKLHTSTPKEAQAVNLENLGSKQGTTFAPLLSRKTMVRGSCVVQVPSGHYEEHVIDFALNSSVRAGSSEDYHHPERPRRDPVYLQGREI